MKHPFKCLFWSLSISLLLWAVILSPLWAATYYVDCNADGDAGAGTGTGAAVAWKTINKVNTSTFSGADQILFNKGCTWREQLIPPSSGTSGHPIIFGSYGTGVKPKIIGSKDLSATGAWTDLGGNKWVTASVIPTDVGNLIFNGEASTGVKIGTVTVSRDATHPATYIDTAGLVQITTTSNVPRIKRGSYNTSGFQANTGSGLMVEAASTNYLTRTDGTSSGSNVWTSWASAGTRTGTPTNSQVAATALTGIANSYAQRIQYTGVVGDSPNKGVQLNGPNTGAATFAQNDYVTVSGWFLSQTGNTGVDLKFEVDTRNSAGSLINSYFSSDFVSSVTTTWRYFTYTVQLPDATTDRVGLKINVGSVGNGDAVDIQVWGIQLEKGAAATSFIPTTTAQLTRNAETVNLTSQGNFYYDPNVTLLYLYSASNPGTFYSGIEAAQVWISDGGISIYNQAYITVQDLDIRYWGQDGIALTTYGHSAGYNNDNIILQQNDISYIGGSYQSASMTRVGNGIQVYGNASNVTVRYNKINQIYDAGLSSQSIVDAAISQTAHNYYQNIVSNSEYGFETFMRGTGATASGINVWNNVFYNNGGGWGHNQRPDGVNGSGLVFGNTDAGEITSSTFKNNIIHTSTEKHVFVYNAGNDLSGWTIDYNTYYPDGASAFIRNVTGYTFADWKTANSGQDTHSITTNPLFVSTVTPDFHLQPTSSAINAGTNVSLTSDYAGTTVPQGSAPDIGAYEFIFGNFIFDAP